MDDFQKSAPAGLEAASAPAAARMYRAICEQPGISISAANGPKSRSSSLERAHRLQEAGLIRIEQQSNRYACYPVAP